ncbi:hypothetical protein H310_03629 [Aphanomyces invadans]|uniref:Uncharacterized protein n=1 Tax=Aphanomyces invadans TaxID=157072 RepID=A0A024UK85_9STRA|nr:hypothetical protein H310_03629 [Aphanomyces invadans]ETW06013.1 hypothetical protein H310_03629 [Aphanomyces invadans]|eukprot:XP_008865790.1 hypothetical protein H310_03629 [Aphanomyces invadans]
MSRRYANPVVTTTIGFHYTLDIKAKRAYWSSVDAGHVKFALQGGLGTYLVREGASADGTNETATDMIEGPIAQWTCGNAIALEADNRLVFSSSPNPIEKHLNSIHDPCAFITLYVDAGL